ncbi:hypothetical protein SB719_22120, partial [Pantoea sp. SIMBA_079]|uniref:hypothetical protein n=1 Tax=Pantoea sp. SIMBA_079 TaxID=3085817 RepID=UPI003995FAF7
EGLLVRIHGGAVPPVVIADEDDEVAPSSPAESGAARTIAVLVPSLNYYWPGVTRGMEQEACRRGVRVLVRAASYSLQDER